MVFRGFVTLTWGSLRRIFSSFLKALARISTISGPGSLLPSRVETWTTPDESTRFFFCALAAGVEGLEDYVDYEPHNPLLDEWEDDLSVPDYSREDAEERLAALRSDFSYVFVDDLPNCLPPFRPINHDTHEVVDNLKIPPRVIGMPDRYAKQWTAHLLKFVETGYWSPQALESACSMFAVPKHDPAQARFVINLKPRNANTIRTALPIPDMRQVRANLAGHPIRSKLDLKKAYKQIRLNWESVQRSGFVTKNGTFVSRVMQQGDCNAPDTMHRVCYMMFSKAMGRFLDTFYDDIFVYSHTRRAHLRYLEIVFTTLRHYKFYLANDKVELMAPRLEALGALISDDGIEVDPKKWTSVQDWPPPKTSRDILRFLGVVQWMGDHLPHLNELASPLTRLTGKVDWDWSPACEASFDAIKRLVPLKLTPLDFSKLESGEDRLFLFTDASMVGSGGWLGQGVSRETALPFRFHSAEFNPAQLNYTTTDQELLAVLDCCLKFRDHLIGWEFTVVCDHEPLKTYHTQPPKQTRRHVRLWETLSEFHFNWEFLPGKKNGLANSLSRLAELMVSEGLLKLPTTKEPLPAENDNVPFASVPSRRAELAMACLMAALRPRPVLAPLAAGKSPFVPSLPLAADLRVNLTASLPKDLLAALSLATAQDTLCKKILANPAAFPSFEVEAHLVYAKETDGFRLVVPRGRVTPAGGGYGEQSPFSPVESVIRLAHETLGHQGAAKTLGWVRRFFWWSTMHADVYDYVSACEDCCRGKAVPAKPFGLVHPLDIPTRPWAWAAIDFVVGLPPVLYNNILVDQILTVTCPFSKMVLLLPLPGTASAEDVADAFYNTVYRRFRSQVSIVSDPNPAKSTYTIAFPPHLRLHPTLHASKLRPHYPNDDDRFPSRAFSLPPPVVPATDGAEAEWEIEKVVAVKTVRGRRMFKVRYLGYSEAEDKFRPEAELRETAPDVLEAYLARQDAVAAARPKRSRGRVLASVLANFWSNRTVSL
ncbi:hypothetical protein JCM11641_002021 [Rhodosporidiobolus odoratus]